MADNKIYVTKDNAIALQQVGNCGVICIRDISDESWTEYLGYQVKLAKANGGGPPYVINYCPHTVPSASHRKAMHDRKADLCLDDIRYSVNCSDSLAVRGAITAISWWLSGTKLKALSPTRLNEGIAWLVENGCNVDVKRLTATFETLRNITHI